MNNSEGSEIVDFLKQYEIYRRLPLPVAVIRQVLGDLGPYPPWFESLYEFTNGLEYQWLTIFPIEDRTSRKTLKSTWNSIQRVNDITKSPHFGGDKELFQQFLIFARLTGMKSVSVSKKDFSIWYEERDKIYMTTFNILDFLRQVFWEIENL